MNNIISSKIVKDTDIHIVKILEKAKEIYLNRIVTMQSTSNRLICKSTMCLSIHVALSLFGINSFSSFRTLSYYIPLFNFEIAVEMFEADAVSKLFGHLSEYDENWWPINNKEIRIRYFDWLINSYK